MVYMCVGVGVWGCVSLSLSLLLCTTVLAGSASPAANTGALASRGGGVAPYTSTPMPPTPRVWPMSELERPHDRRGRGPEPSPGSLSARQASREPEPKSSLKCAHPVPVCAKLTGEFD